MTVYVFGNPELPEDSLPLRLLPELKQRLPQVEFAAKDPNEEWDVPEELTLIDTVVGIPEPRLFESLDIFAAAPRLTAHDFDAYANLRLLQKMGRLKKIRIIGLPPMIPLSEALEFALKALRPT
jgi:hypothetical protein